MTKTAERLMTALQELPDEEQEARAASYLEDLRRHRKSREEERERYSFFKALREANIDLPSDYSETYEERLYGPRSNGE